MTRGVELPEMPTFGRYQPLFRIAAGGMAEVYGARAVGEAGFQRWVALKRILPDLTDDARFVEMFLDEARLAANVRSAHVVPTLDLGRASDGSLYLVMDLVVGVTLGALIQGAARAGHTLPVSVAVEIVAQAAQGLHDAHEARSPEGEPLNIVHRDVSLRNILVGIDGCSKILDFGVAQGELRATQTAIGEVKGSHAYFSPEQATLQKLDRRSDVYSIGIVLWEALTSQRLFRGDAFIEARNDPPRVDSIRADVPAHVADVVARALQRNRDERYQTAAEVTRALRESVGPVWSDASSLEVSAFVRQYGGPTIDRIQTGMQRSSLERVAPAPAERASPKQETSRLHVYGTSFIGREHDEEALEAILARGDRLVTLFGPGGVGKTRLAIELSQRVRESFPGGVTFCDFAEARTAEGICYVVASALGVAATRGRDLSGVIDALGRALAARGRSLVVLDNVEQAMAHVSQTLGQWLVSAPNVIFLVTSRERLRLAAETLYELAPLDVGSGITHSAAANLFIDRAMKVRRDLRIDDETSRAISSIVKRLDGVPLAIELAASRLRGMDPVQLAEQLSERLRAPSSGARDANPRQATLDAAIRWSWDLLDSSEQAVFASLSVFHGGFDLRAAVTVAEPPHGHAGMTQKVMGQLLEQLVDKSLVRFVSGTPTRFGMLQSIREFAAVELEAQGLTASTMERYTRYFASLAVGWDDPRSVGQPAEIEREIENVVHAFRWTLARGVRDDAQLRQLLLLALAAEPILGVRGPLSLARQILEQTVAACDGRDSDADMDARARLGLARVLFKLGDRDGASTALAEARLVAGFASGRRAQGWVALTEAEQHWAGGNLARVIVMCAHAVEAGEEEADLVLASRARFLWGAALHRRGDHAAAKVELERARANARTLRYEQLEARVDATLAEVAADMGDLTTAARIATNASALALRASDGPLEAHALRTLGAIALQKGDSGEASTLLLRALELAREAGDARGEGLVLCAVGVAEECAGLIEQARVTLSAAISANQRAGSRVGEALGQIYLGRVYARTGRLEEAEASLTAGTAILREVGDRIRVLVARLCTAHLDLAKADRAAAALDSDGAQTHRRRARQLARNTREELDAGRIHGIEVQHALGLLESEITKRRDSARPPARKSRPPR